MSNPTHHSTYSYDKFNRISSSKWSLGNIAIANGYIYGDSAVSNQKTGYQRIVKKDVRKIFRTSFCVISYNLSKGNYNCEAILLALGVGAANRTGIVL